MDTSKEPLVSIIAISYNHAPFIREALESVFAQTYSNIELIIADDASTDDSIRCIEEVCKGKVVTIISNNTSIGNCRTFNEAFKLAKGKYIIDFALDDRMYSERIRKQVDFFETYDQSTGVVFGNVDVINESGILLYNHYPRFNHPTNKGIPEGYVFEYVLSYYYINPVSMMLRREVLEDLNGYDETLSYEDFDFWIRSSAKYKYAYLPDLLSSKRIVTHSLSSAFSKRNQEHMFESTLRVCKKAWWLCKNDEDIKALVKRCRYELKQSVRYGYKNVSNEYLQMLKEIDKQFFIYHYAVRVFQLF